MNKPASFMKTKASLLPEVNGSTPPSFLKKTYEILENPIYSDIICWNEDGKAIIIKDIPELVDKVLPIFFKHKNFTSYVRQLNLYGFRKVKGSSHFQAYYHPMFQRGKKELLARMKRKNNDNLLIFKPHLEEMEASKGADDVKLPAEESAPLSQDNQVNEEAEGSEVDNLQAKKVHKELNERINMVENQLKQFTEQNRILVNIIQKRDTELDSLIRRCMPVCAASKDGDVHSQAPDFSHQISIPQPLVSTNALVMANPILVHKLQSRNLQIIPNGQPTQQAERSNSSPNINKSNSITKSDEGGFRQRVSQRVKESKESGSKNSPFTSVNEKTNKTKDI